MQAAARGRQTRKEMREDARAAICAGLRARPRHTPQGGSVLSAATHVQAHIGETRFVRFA